MEKKSLKDFETEGRLSKLPKTIGGSYAGMQRLGTQVKNLAFCGIEFSEGENTLKLLSRSSDDTLIPIEIDSKEPELLKEIEISIKPLIGQTIDEVYRAKVIACEQK